MRIGFNGLYLRQRSVGLGKYTFELLDHLTPEKWRITLYVEEKGHASDLSRKFGGGIDIEEVRVPGLIPNEFIRDRTWECLMFSRAKRDRVDVLHSPYFVCSPFRQRFEIVTIHDLIQLKFPEYITSRPRAIHWKYNQSRARSLPHIVTDSMHSKGDIVSLLGAKPENVSIVYPGVSDTYRAVTDSAKVRRISAKYKLPDRFILYLGGYDKRKNVDMLLKSYRQLIQRCPRLEQHLVLAGEVPHPIPGLVPNIGDLIDQFGIPGRVTLCGLIAEEDMPGLYTLADLFVYPSIYEGFGLPVLEAMACGTPTIAAAASSIPEILDRRDLLFNPNEKDEIADVMFKLLSDPALCKSVSAWNVQRAGEFSWARTSKLIMNVYAMAAHASPHHP